MIKTFANRDTEHTFNRRITRRFGAIGEEVWKKLVYVNAAVVLADLAQVPGNRLEKLKGNRKGQWSIRVNRQWRICFVWRDGNAYDVEVCDYH